MLLMASFWVSAPARLCLARQPSFAVQVMSGADKNAAAQFAEELMHQGFEASIAEIVEKEKPVYKVRVGNFTNRKAAEQLYEALRMKGIDGWVVQVHEPAGPQAHAAETAGPAPAQSPEPIAMQPRDSENAASAKPFELILNTAPACAADNTTAPSLKTEQAPVSARSLQPAAAQPDCKNAASEKLFELVINPVPTFAEQEKQTASPPKADSAPACLPVKTYKYFNPGDATLHITNSIETVPVQLRSRICEIAIVPIYFKSLDLHDMSMNTDIEGKPVIVVLEGITRPERAPPTQEVRNFEAALQAKPLRIKYYPERTDPDGTLHGALFFSDGASVEMDMVRRKLAACAAGEFSSFQQNPCTDAQQKSEGQINTIAAPR